MKKRTAAILFGGIGGYSVGAMASKVEAYGKVHEFEILCSVDYDPVACKNHDLITGENKAVVMDLFDRDQYRKWNKCEPPDDWREMTPWDLWLAFGCQVPDYFFISAPCKGFSGLLPASAAASEQYQALNLLMLRSLRLCMEACELYGDGVLPAFVHFENVPRIKSRGKAILVKVRKILIEFGFAFDERSNHNLGIIGGLGQDRVRYLILARNEKRIPNFCYLPPKRKLKTIGDVIGPLPTPGDTVLGGPLHRLPNLQWKTWVRLALIPAGGDWRDLNKIDWKQYHIEHAPRGGALAVEDWDKTCRTVTGGAGPGRSNGAAAISDPRTKFKPGTHASIYRVSKSFEVGPAVTGAIGPNNGAISVSDPNIKAQNGKHSSAYSVVRTNEPSPCVTGTRFGSGAIAIADPSISDRPGRYTDKYRVQSIDKPAATVTGVTDVQQGAQLIADPTLGCSPRAGSYGVQDWNKTSTTVTGSGDIHSGNSAISDPRIPGDKEGGVWVIVAEDGTWHRPLTTYELAMLQSFDSHLPDGRPFQLEGCTDAKAREYIGNAVPKHAATAMGNVILIAMANAEAGVTFEMSHEEVWVTPKENQQPVLVH